MSRFIPLLVVLVVNLPPRVVTAQTSVTVVADFQDELGCAGDWDPGCGTTGLAYDAADDVWQGTFNIPAGTWQYKVALDGAWAESYPAANVVLNLASATDVKFYYDHKTNFVADSIGSAIVVAIGDFQNEIGCPGDWQPDCLQGWLTDTDGDGTFTFMTSAIPPGSYEAKAAHNETFDETYPAANLPFVVATDPILFSYVLSSNALTIASVEPPPSAVTAVGDWQDELGCPGDWDPTCATTGLTYDTEDDVWQATFDIPAGNWQYKVALDGLWDESYPASNAPLSLPSATDVKFYYDDKTNFVADSIGSIIVVAIGDFQDEIGCNGGWQPDCLRGWMTDPDGDGTFTFATTDIPAGNYEAKAALDETFDVTYPANNLPFTVPAGKTTAAAVLFSYVSATNAFTISVSSLPVELTSFDVVTRTDRMTLYWTTATETNNAGFAVEHKSVGNEFREIGFVTGQGTSDIENTYRFDVHNLDPGLHRFRLRQVDFDGTVAYSPIVEAVASVPAEFVLEPAYPNPFNPSTTVRFAVSSTQEVAVTLTDATGRTVRVIFNGIVEANQMQTVLVDGNGLASGIYQLVLTGERFRTTEQVTLLK